MQDDIAKIARKHLGLSTLATQNSDRLDFSDQAVWNIKEALEAAYAAGQAAARKAKKPQRSTPQIEATRNLAKVGDWDRKPSDWYRITGTITEREFNEATIGATIEEPVLCDFAGPYPCSDFKKPMPPVFTTVIRGRRYVIRTEGGNYARYVARIV